MRWEIWLRHTYRQRSNGTLDWFLVRLTPEITWERTISPELISSNFPLIDTWHSYVPVSLICGDVTRNVHSSEPSECKAWYRWSFVYVNIPGKKNWAKENLIVKVHWCLASAISYRVTQSIFRIFFFALNYDWLFDYDGFDFHKILAIIFSCDCVNFSSF